ncbi:hypothetical protein EsDP_00006607 [Epichloe bromicola]|uniref:ATP-grasp domain-containing protein n=1 Tax=Epichloe bromicola TaxID=79588 RepID=A0ABQ0CY49_9HYPO
MKICIISLSKNAASRLERHDGLPDPTHYIPQYRHEFVDRQVTKHNAQYEIDKLCCESFDAFMNCMVGRLCTSYFRFGHSPVIQGVDVDGIEATKHLESKNVTILTNPSSLLATSKLDLRDDANEPAFKTPHNTYGKYPKIVKYFDKSGSLGLDRNFVCYNEQAVRERITLLREQDPTFGILVQDYIFGDECAAVVIDLGRHVIALSPVKFVFPVSTSADAEFLTRDDKNGSVTAREISHVIIEGELRERLQWSAVNAFKNIKASYQGAFAHVTMRVERNTGNIYVIDVDFNPYIFNRKGYRFDGDFMLEATFPGKQEAFLDTILTIKRSQLGSNKSRITHTAAVYDSWSDTYDEFWESTNVSKIQQFTVANFDFTGSVLDLACGTGVFGRILHAHGAKTTGIVGVEISAGMLCAADIKKYYKKPLWNCSMQEYVMVIGAQVVFPSRSLLMAETAP